MIPAWIVQLVIVLLAAYGGYAIAEGVNNRQLIWELFGTAALAGAWGLLRNSLWSQYVIYVIAAMLTVSWAFVVWRLTAEGWLNDHPAAMILALVPGALMIAVCVAVSLAVFRHFHPAKN
jgi:hypothetical protein